VYQVIQLHIDAPQKPAAHLPAALRWSAAMVGRVAHRFIAAGSGCDCSVSVGADSIGQT
jgi:hypothetical protein